MEIIVVGNPELARKIRDRVANFRCKMCGCVWDAEMNEYESDETSHPYMSCSTCKNYVNGNLYQEL